MNFEAPADGWYVWLGIALTSTLVAGVALTLPAEPPPDANSTANAVEHVATARYGATATCEHNAEAVKIGSRTITMRNEAGTARATITVGKMTPLTAVTNETRRSKLRRIADGMDPESVLGANASETLSLWVADIQQTLQTQQRGWHTSNEPIRVRKVTTADGDIILVSVN